MIFHANHRSQRAALDQLHFVGLVQIPVLLLEVSVDIPRVPLLGLIHERLQQVAADVKFFGPPVSVSAGASDSVPLRLSNRLVMQPVCGSIFTRMNSFSRVSAEAFSKRMRRRSDGRCPATK